MDHATTRPYRHPLRPIMCESCGRPVLLRTVMVTATSIVCITCYERARTVGERRGRVPMGEGAS